jgi:hypothetical protein
MANHAAIGLSLNTHRALRADSFGGSAIGAEDANFFEPIVGTCASHRSGPPIPCGSAISLFQVRCVADLGVEVDRYR